MTVYLICFFFGLIFYRCGRSLDHAKKDSFSIFLLTFPPNHSHCKISAIKHRPAGDKEPSHLAGGALRATSPTNNQPVMALLLHTSPSYLPAFQPQPGKTTCRNNDKTIGGVACGDRLASAGCDSSSDKVFGVLWPRIDV